MENSNSLIETEYCESWNSSNEIKCRKYESILRITGVGVVVFGLWNFAKVMMQVLFNFVRFEEKADFEFTKELKIVFVATIIVIMVLDILFRLYIGQSAIKEARGSKKGILYLVFSFLIIVWSIASAPLYFGDNDFSVETIATVITEVTSLIITVELIYSSIFIKKYRKECRRKKYS